MSHVCKIINGKGLAEDIQIKLAKKISNFRVKPKLAVILVGHDPRSEIYIEFKKKACEEVGIDVKTIEFEDNIKQVRLERTIDELNNDEDVHGILVQLPLPKQIDEKKIIELIDPMKDVDGFHPINIGRIMGNIETGLTPATPKGIMRIIDSIGYELEGKNVVVVGSGYLVGRPMLGLLLNRKATVTVCHQSTKEIENFTLNADVLVVGVGKPGLITKDMVKKNAVVIDAGIATVENKVVGDIDFDEICKVAQYVTPTPGGVGPMTIAMLLENTWQAMRMQHGYKDY